MTLQQYESDISYLLGIFSRRHPGRIQFLNKYLKARNYTNEELHLLIFIAEDLSVEDAISKMEGQELLTSDEDGFLLNSSQTKPIKRLRSKRDPWELINLLVSNLKAPSYKFEPMSPRYLVAGQEQRLIIAEGFMLQFEYFNKDGSWNENNNIGDLVTFLNLLKTAGIIKYTKEKEMDSFFSKRYKMEQIGSLMRPNKFNSHSDFGQYIILARQLGLKFEI